MKDKKDVIFSHKSSSVAVSIVARKLPTTTMWMSKLLVAALCAQTSSAGWVYSGNTNAAEGDNAVVLGGDSNQASATNGLVGGGSANQVSEKATCAVIGGGGSNVNTGEYATVAAGRKNRAYSK